ncbi:hypothetical protein L6R52_41630 [Myxococcota bacterium]|nr:hypothetical protein [Myxococcota bacterium]
MRRSSTALVGAVLVLGLSLLAPRIAGAQSSVELDERAVFAPAGLSTELIDPNAHSRFHLVSRATFSDGESVFSDSSLWTFEARAHVRVLRGLALSATLPFGLSALSGLERKFYFGNFSLGVAGGGTIHLGGASATPGPRLHFAGAADVYAPTAPEPDEEDLALRVAQGGLAGTRALEPWLYLSNVMSFRARAQVGFSIDVVTASLEAGIVPAFTLDTSSELILWTSVAGRLSAMLAESVEPFVELGSAIQLSGPGDVSPLVQLTPGVRLHLGGFDPALFVSIPISEPVGLLFGIDLAGAFVPSRRASGEGVDDFLGDL